MANKYNIVVGVKLNTGDVSKQLEKISSKSNAFNGIANGAKEATKQTMSFGAMLKTAYEKFAIWSIATVTWYAVVRAMKDAVKQAIEIDTAFTRIKMVTMATDQQIQKMKQSYIELAKEMKVSLSTVTDAAEAWLRTGMNAADATDALKASIVLSTDAFMDSATATQYLVAAQKAYGLEASQLMGVVDKLTVLDSKAATTAADLGEALSMSASSAGLAGIEMDKYLAILATASETTQQSASNIGNAWKTILARLQQVKLGATMDEEGQDISNVDKLLKEYNIDLMGTTNNLENMEALLDTLGARWKNYTAAQKSEIATIVAGVRQRDKLIATLNNYDRVMELTTESINSQGVAMDKYAIAADSTQKKIDALKTSWTALIDATIKSEYFEWILSAGKSLVDFGTKAGGLIPIITELSSAILILKSAMRGNVAGVIGGLVATGVSIIDQIGESIVSSRVAQSQKRTNWILSKVEEREKETKSINNNVLAYGYLQSVQDKTIEQNKEMVSLQKELAKQFDVSVRSIKNYSDALDIYAEKQKETYSEEILQISQRLDELYSKRSKLQTGQGVSLATTYGESFWTRFGDIAIYSAIADFVWKKERKVYAEYTAQIEELEKKLKELKASVVDIDLAKSILGDLPVFEKSEKGAKKTAEALDVLYGMLSGIGSDELRNAVKSTLDLIKSDVETFQSTDFVLTEYYDKQLEALKEQKELEDKLADEKEKQEKITEAELKKQEALLEVEKARAALAEAREKKIKVFRMGKGMVYEEDTASIASAQQDLDKALEGYQDAIKNFANVQQTATEQLISAVEKLQKAYGLALLGDEEGKARKFFQTQENLEWYQGLSEEAQLAALMEFMTPENKVKAQALWGLDENLISQVGDMVRSRVFGEETNIAPVAEYIQDYVKSSKEIPSTTISDETLRMKESRMADVGGNSIGVDAKRRNALLFFIQQLGDWDDWSKKNYLSSSDMFSGYLRTYPTAFGEPYTSYILGLSPDELESFYTQLRRGVLGYHSGGIVGEKAFSSDSEMYAKLLKGEIVLPQGKFNQIIDRVHHSSSNESTILNIGNISLPNVDDADSFVRELQRISFAR